MKTDVGGGNVVVMCDSRSTNLTQIMPRDIIIDIDTSSSGRHIGVSRALYNLLSIIP